MKIEAIIFDLGGVLLNIDYSLSISAFKRLGIKYFEEKFSQAAQSELFDKLETGKITNGEFCSSIREISSKKIANKDIIDAWNAMLLDFPQDRLKLLEKVKQGYQCYLLSNTNSIHLKDFSDILKKENNVGNFRSFFHKTYFSHEIRMRKPDVATFKWVLAQNNLLPQTTLFIDDSLQHIEGAKQVGLVTYHLTKKPVQSLFDNNGRLLNEFLTEFN